MAFSVTFLFLTVANHVAFGFEAGQNVLQPRIIGGRFIEITEAPYMAAIVEVDLNMRYHVCGGSIITPMVILTAAHCLYFTVNPLWVVAGQKNWLKGDLVQVSRGIPHDHYNKVNARNDVGLLYLVSRLPIGDTIKTLDLSLHAHPHDRAAAFVAGWGRTYCSSIYRSDLKGLDVAVHPDEDCIKIKGEEFFVGDHLCAGNQGRTTDEVYIGDSGGPLVYNNEQIGIVSRTQCKDDDANYLASYASVIHHRWWIVNKTTELIRETEVL